MGPDKVRAYWTKQWSEIDPDVEPVAFQLEDTEHILVDVHQVVSDFNGSVVAVSMLATASPWLRV